jgi:hypothetical protein
MYPVTLVVYLYPPHHPRRGMYPVTSHPRSLVLLRSKLVTSYHMILSINKYNYTNGDVAMAYIQYARIQHPTNLEGKSDQTAEKPPSNVTQSPPTSARVYR